MFAPLLALALSFTAPTAEAGVYVNVSVPGVQVSVNPWSPHWTPAPRAGYRWVGGHWQGRDWVPGYWVPTYARAGYVWVPGYWDHMSYVEGYWRPAYSAGYVWVEPCWYGGVYYAGGWVSHSVYRPGQPVYAYRSNYVRHERAEDRHEQAAWARDERHEDIVRHEAAEDRAENRHEHAQDSYDGRGDGSHGQTGAYAETGHQQAYAEGNRQRTGSASGASAERTRPATTTDTRAPRATEERADATSEAQRSRR